MLYLHIGSVLRDTKLQFFKKHVKHSLYHPERDSFMSMCIQDNFPLPICQSHTDVLLLNSAPSQNSASKWDACFSTGVRVAPNPPWTSKTECRWGVRGGLLTVTNTPARSRSFRCMQGSNTMTMWEGLPGTRDCDQRHKVVLSWLIDLKGWYA